MPHGLQRGRALRAHARAEGHAPGGALRGGLLPLLAPIKGTLPREVLPRELLRAAKKPLPPMLLVRATGRGRPELNQHLDAFVREARRKGVKPTLLELKDGHHGFDAVDDYEDTRDILRATGEFLNKQLGR